MQLTSTAFADGETLPEQFTCDGAGLSPPLAWGEPPAGTKSFALVVEDPDAPRGTFRHWGAYDIPGDTRQLQTGAGVRDADAFRQVKNDFGDPGYGGACPPRGDQPHQYHFRLLALDVARLPGSPAKPKDILDAAEGHVLGSAELTATYRRD